MKREIIEIRGNITPTMNRLELMAKEREEREKQERDEKWRREREERERKEAAWKKEHPILDKFTYISYYSYDTYSWPGDYINIHFYEWSDINSSPRHFPYSIEFYKFLDSCKINLTPEQNTKIKTTSGCHITCVPGTHDLIVANCYDSLKSQYHMAVNLAKILEPVPEVNPKYPVVLQ